ncbi:MAG: nuclear transport factor 2 family protein [Gilvibacter sp.]
MKPFILLLLLLCFSTSIAQDEFTKDDAKAIIDTFFEGFHKGDTLMMTKVMMPDVVLQTAFTTGKGEEMVVTDSADKLLEAIANRPSEQKWDERLLSYEVQIDGNLAHVWTPYEFYVNGNFSHCGANAFTLAKTSEGFKILHLIDSRRRASCKTD